MMHSLCALDLGLTHEEKEWIKAHPSITFAVSSKNLPHSFIDKDGEVKGIQIDFIDLIAQKTGINIQKEVSVWPKTLENAMAHKVDGIVDLAKREEREKALNFTEVYLKAPFALISNEGYPNIQDLNQFCGKKVAITFGTSAAQFLQKEYPCIELVDTHTENMVEKVMKKEVDAFFERYEVFLFHDKQALFSGLKVMYYKFIPPSGFSRLGVRNDAPLLLSILNKAIQSITMEELNKITSKWVGSVFPSFSDHDKVSLTPQEKNYLVAKQTIKMCTNPDMIPFEHIDTQGKYKGISSDIVQIISKDIDTSIELIPTKSWLETLEKFNNKECDMIPMAINTPNRQKMMNFTQPYITEPTVIATKDDTFFIQDSSALKNKKIGVINGYAFVELLQQKHPSIEIVTVDNSLDGLKRVQKGELFGYVDALPTIAYTMQKNALLNLKIAGRLEFDVTISMALQKEDPLLHAIMQKALDNIEKEQIDSIIGKWISIKIEQSLDYRIVMGLMLVIALIVLWNYTLRRKLRIELRKNEVQAYHLFEKAKQAELSLVIGNISHQFRDALSKLSYINLSLMSKLQKKQVIAPDELCSATRQVETSIEFMSNTMHTFLEFYRPTTHNTHFTILESIQEILVILDTKLKQSNVHVEFDEKDNLSLFGNKNEWMQIWLNLFNNTMHQATKKEIKEVKVFITIDKECIVFEDNCSGFEPDILEKLNKGNSERLGLKICQSILEKHHWKLEISNTAKGAKVQISLCK